MNYDEARSNVERANQDFKTFFDNIIEPLILKEIEEVSKIGIDLVHVELEEQIENYLLSKDCLMDVSEFVELNDDAIEYIEKQISCLGFDTEFSDTGLTVNWGKKIESNTDQNQEDEPF